VSHADATIVVPPVVAIVKAVLIFLTESRAMLETCLQLQDPPPSPRAARVVLVLSMTYKGMAAGKKGNLLAHIPQSEIRLLDEQVV
jgi:hypothetical protein